ncbi:NF-kappa-B inhibitor cactus isoform X2 [Onthophagus taurus]|uniref:NF-kappa-B inhibitor cactus isoform X2 n=1 Tax=Onthophagus taurus TaxID=166361 RepID=UPI000C20B2C0|nr:NF-kappa-B inhibitor cactus isoform X2 [Onthophagus taurus]
MYRACLIGAALKTLQKFSDETSLDDKHNLYETSQVDSGFLSGNIPSEEFESSSSMRLDSGVCVDAVTRSFSDLNFKSSDGLNDLNSGSIKSPIDSTQTSHTQKQNWEIYHQQDEDGNTFLHHSVIEHFPEVALAVIRATPTPTLLNTENDDGQTALHLAVLTNQWKIARMLIVAGAKPSPINRQGDSPLHIAARIGDVECCKAITYPVQQQERERLGLSYPPHAYDRCDLDQWNFDGQTCVHVAALHNQLEFLKHLVWLGADVNAREGKGGYTILHFAVQMGDERLIRFLLSCRALNVSVLTYGGRTPLELGYPVQEHVIKLLKEQGIPSPDQSEYEYDSDESDEDDDVYGQMNMLSQQQSSFAIGASA